MNYFQRSIIDTIKTAGIAIRDKNISNLSQALAVLQNEIVRIEDQLQNLIYNMMLDNDHPLVKKENKKKLVMEQFVKGFEMYYIFLTESSTDYVFWANSYSNHYQKLPSEIFNELIHSGELDQSSEEYELYRALKSVLNPNKSNTPDPQQTDTIKLYHLIDDVTKVAQIKNTGKLIVSPYSDQLYFLSSPEDIKKYYNKYQVRVMDTSVDPPIMKPLTRVTVAECVMTNKIVTSNPSISPDEPPTFLVNVIYIPWILVTDVTDLLIEPNKIFSRRIGRAKVGTG